MIKRLPDGTVISSALSVKPLEELKKLQKNNPYLKLGVVFGIHYPDQDSNKSKKFIEYDVRVIESRIDGSASTVNYLRCKVLDKFCTPNNYEYFTLQPAEESQDSVLKNGAQVLLLAVDGNANTGGAIIIGGVNYPMPEFKSQDGQFYEWQFNGINIRVDKDGQYFLTFNTPINPDKKKKDEKAAGTKIEIFKDGRMKLSDNEKQSWEIDRVSQKSTWTNGAESIIIDKKNKKIDLVSSGTTSETIKDSKTVKISNKDHVLETASGSIIEKSGKDINRDAKANIQEKAGANWQFEAGGNVTIKAGGNVMIQGGGMAQLKGTTNLIGDGSVPAAGVGISQCIGTGNLGYPVISNIITGSATVLIGA